MKCNTPGCKNKRLRDRTMCGTCKSKTNRKNNPITATYHNLKSKAKTRGIPFTLSKKYWKQFCEETNYLMLRGKGPNDMTIDRPNPLIGYSDYNIRMITQHENGKKGQEDKVLHQQARIKAEALLKEIEIERAAKNAPVGDKTPF